MDEYWKELFFWIALAVGLTFFIAGFKPLLKIAAARTPFIPNAIAQALAA